MKVYSVLITSSAEKDLMDIVQYISSQLLAPKSALRTLEVLEEKIAELSQLPERCPLVSDARLAYLGYRKLVVDDYIVFNSIDTKEDRIYVERILHSRRNWVGLI